MEFEDIFGASDYGDMYDRFRPTYSAQLYDRITAYYNNGQAGRTPSLAVDVGCGCGKFTWALGGRCGRVLGVDSSSSQVLRAQATNSATNVQFAVGQCDKLPVETGSADLVTCASALIWFPSADKFFSEVSRVLGPGGCLAVVGYSMSFPTSEAGEVASIRQVAFNEVCHIKLELPRLSGWKTMAMFLDAPQWAHMETRCRMRELSIHRHTDVSLPMHDVTHVNDLKNELAVSLESLLGYFASLTFYREYQHLLEERSQSDGPEETIQDPLVTLKQKLEATMTGPDEKLTVAFEEFILMGRKPSD